MTRTVGKDCRVVTFEEPFKQRRDTLGIQVGEVIPAVATEHVVVRARLAASDHLMVGVRNQTSMRVRS